MASSNPFIPYVRDGKLHDHAGQVICQVSATDRAAWLAWLETARSFAFVASNGAHCTVIKERRRSSSGAIHHYWYAYRSVRNQKRRLSLGKSERLDLARLSEAAARLAQEGRPFERGPFALARRAAIFNVGQAC